MSAKAEFLNLSTVQDTLARLLPYLSVEPKTETIPVSAALGRILASAPLAEDDLPNFIRSTMDGYAVRAADTFGASPALPAYLTCIGAVLMGQVPDFRLESGQTAEIHTGAMLPDGADAVVMIEQTQPLNETEIEILKPAATGENLVQVGEDVRRGESVLQKGARIRPQDIGGLLAAGILEVEVIQPPHIAILSCGDELIPPDQSPRFGQIRDINAPILAAMIAEIGANPQQIGIAADRLDSLLSMAQGALAQADMLIISAGSSVSVRDLTAEAIQQLGAPGIIQHGLTIKPGKPAILAVCDSKPVIGLPGNPVSAVLTARLIVLPIIRQLLGEIIRPRATIRTTLSQNIASANGRLDLVPVRLIQLEDGQMLAEPVLGKSNLIFRLVKADGLLEIPLNLGGLKAGAEVEISLI